MRLAHKLILTATLAGFVVFISCAPSVKTYRSLSPQAAVVDEVFQLPMLSSLLQPSEARRLDDLVAAKLAKSNPHVVFRKVKETDELFNGLEHTERGEYYANNISTIDSARNLAFLQTLHDSLGIRAILLGEMSTLDEYKGWGIGTDFPSKSSITKVKKSGVRISYKLYWTANGTVLWEMSVTSTFKINDDPEQFDEAMANARWQLLHKIGESRFVE